MRVLLFTGKGGVGKTTLAAATGAALAARGGKTLVVSTDPAHSLGDALGRPLSADPAEVDTCLHGAQVDTRALADGSWHALRDQLRSALVSGAGLATLDAEELTVLPGVDELLALTEVRRLAESGPWETVVVDCGPTAETLRLLALPEAVSGYLARMYGWKAKLSGLARSVDRLAAHLESLRALLTDPARTSVRLVLTPERVVVAETRRTLTSLALRGIRVDGMIVNRLMPAPGLWRGGAAAWLRTRRAQQEEVLAELAASGFGDGLLRSVEHRAAEPVGLPALLEIAHELYGSGTPLSGDHNLTPLLQVSEVDSGFQLRIALPLARDAVVDLARVDDDLAVTVDGFRRLVALPEPLRACRIVDAESDSRGLLVHLERTA
ncbi:ArsA family ATPase [Prauserella muralis]|uniref:Arsenic-transporting ATPase n=1 Tax=Prauserella muralis TaxID=588067 RepID=A0A2V4B225_9PSEU|nr:ArsA family ATPase [Prauserella muralis]PXY28042.1 arsenic-transporting ATPase [Prauserella muralis]TWE22163.1 arsenite efflux ATP-binding protein ArsA [Prauserella muralis]